MGECKWCHGTGTEYVEPGSSLCYRCPDCNGTGYIPECDNFGREYVGEYCDHCYTECDECGEVCLIDDIEKGICEDCAAIEEEEVTA
jgi:hypothetical protein